MLRKGRDKNKKPGGDRLSHGEAPHYHRRGGVSRPSSGWDRVVPSRYGRQAEGESPRRGGRRGVKQVKGCRKWPGAAACTKRLGCYMVKPHGPLVRVSFTPYGASTSRLSTSLSATDLEESQGLGTSHLGVGFPLRCFQRLSRPYLATRLCSWQNNRHTSGTSTPVLSY